MQISGKLLLSFLLLFLVSCGGDKNQMSDAPLTDQQLENGIGPIDSVRLGPINQQLANRGEKIFRAVCMKCHTLDQSVLGPPLRDVTQRRSPEFIMNVILNPQENVMRHPELQKYHNIYNNYMTDQGLDSTAARAILEYLRDEAP